MRPVTIRLVKARECPAVAIIVVGAFIVVGTAIVVPATIATVCAGPSSFRVWMLSGEASGAACAAGFLAEARRGEIDPTDPALWKVKHRVVVDFKASGVNAAAAKVHIRMPPVGEAIGMCTAGGYGAVANIVSGYYHVPLADDVTRGWMTFEQLFEGEWRLFRPTRMSFGAHASSAVFCVLTAEARLILDAHAIKATAWVGDWFFAHQSKRGPPGYVCYVT